MGNKAILIISSDEEKRESFLKNLHKKINFSYVKFEALLSSISETLNRRITEEESIKFFNKFIYNINKGNEIYVIDLNDCKDETLNKYIENKEIDYLRIDEKESEDLINKVYKGLNND